MHLPLSFAPTGLCVSYTGSELPQELDIRLSLSAAADDAMALYFVERWTTLINVGAAGGACFAPELGQAEILSDLMQLDSAGPDFGFKLRWAAVSPRFLRKIVEDTVGVAAEVDVVALSIVGAIPTQSGSSLSIDAGILLAQMEDPQWYVEQWPNLPFPVVHTRAPRGFNLRVELANKVDDQSAKAFEVLIGRWLDCLVTYPDNAGRLLGERSSTRIARGDFEMQLGMDRFSFGSAATAPLVNMLARFHREHLPITELELNH